MGNLPTRKGPWIGRGNERQMMSESDVGGIRKRYRTNPDGSVTMLKTRAGWPQFTTTEVKKTTTPPTPAMVIFQAYPYATIPWPSSPFPLSWKGDHATSKLAALSLATTSETAKGNATWVGATKVVSWFGLSSFGPNDTSLFSPKNTEVTRYNLIGMSSSREGIQPECVWVDGVAKFNVPSPYRVICAALVGDVLRVVLYNRTMITMSTAHAAGGSGGNNVAYRMTSPLLLQEISNLGAGSVLSSATIDVIPVGNYWPYSLIQNFRFNADGSRFAGLVGYYTGTVPMVPRVVEYEFSSRTKTVDLRYGDEVERFSNIPTYPSDPYYTSFVVDTGLPVLNPGYIKFTYDPSGSGYSEEIPLAVGYAGGATLRTLVKKVQYGAITREDDVVRDRFSSLAAYPSENLSTDNEYIKFDVEDLADANHAALNAARAAVGLGPAPVTAANYGPVNPTLFSGVPDNNERESGAYIVDSKPIFLWACVAKRRYTISDHRAYTIERFELHDSSGEKVSGGYDRAVSVTTNKHRVIENATGTQAWTASAVFDVTTEERSVSNNGQTATYEVSVVSLSYAKTYLTNGVAPDPVVEEDDGVDNIVAADLRFGRYIREQSGVRSVATALPSRSYPWSIPFDANLPDVEKSLLFDNLTKPVFGISAFAIHGSGGNAVFAQTDPWGGGNQLSYWGSGSAVFSGPFEAPIYFRK